MAFDPTYSIYSERDCGAICGQGCILSNLVSIKGNVSFRRRGGIGGLMQSKGYLAVNKEKDD